MRMDVERAGEQPADILTPRLLLRPASLEVLRADLEGRAALAKALRAVVPADWPPDLYDAGAIQWSIRALERNPAVSGWVTYYFLRTSPAGAPPLLLGAGGFKGPPDDEGTVEIGYSIVQSERRHGYATESARGLLARAFAHPRVRRVAAETLPDLVASIGVLEKIGMNLVRRGIDQRAKDADSAGWREAGVIRFEIDRASYELSSHRLSS